MKLPRELGPIHFVGIGGIGMSGIAEVLANQGYRVQGSDASEGTNLQRLRDKGVHCVVGHKAENLGEAEVVVVSPPPRSGAATRRSSWRWRSACPWCAAPRCWPS